MKLAQAFSDNCYLPDYENRAMDHMAFFTARAQRFDFLEKRDGDTRVVALPIQGTRSINPARRHRLRRRGSFAAALDNEETMYFMNATIGTPPQPIRLHLDTGSSDLWVNTPSSGNCLVHTDQCELSGTYVANDSSTSQYIGSYFNISYLDGSNAEGDYVSDTVTVGSQQLDRLQFGIGYGSSSAQGILGIGYEINEVQVGRAHMEAYRNLPSEWWRKD